LKSPGMALGSLTRSICKRGGGGRERGESGGKVVKGR
jgi:hypothetical protein